MTIRWATLGTRLVLFFDGSTASRPFNLARSGRPPLACTTTTPDRHRTVILSMQTSPTPEASASPPRPPGHVPPARLALRSRDSRNRPTPHSPSPLAFYLSPLSLSVPCLFHRCHYHCCSLSILCSDPVLLSSSLDPYYPDSATAPTRLTLPVLFDFLSPSPSRPLMRNHLHPLRPPAVLPTLAPTDSLPPLVDSCCECWLIHYP